MASVGSRLVLRGVRIRRQTANDERMEEAASNAEALGRR
jgi:hypothetical protein